MLLAHHKITEVTAGTWYEIDLAFFVKSSSGMQAYSLASAPAGCCGNTNEQLLIGGGSLNDYVDSSTGFNRYVSDPFLMQIDPSDTAPTSSKAVKFPFLEEQTASSRDYLVFD